MITLDRHRTIRAVYWAVLVHFAVSTLAPLVVDRLPLHATPSREALLHMVERLLDSPNTYVVLAVLMAAIGYFWPGDAGKPTTDIIGRAVALGLVAGLVLVGLSHYFTPDIGFWTGFKLGFLLAALAPPPSRER